MGGMVPFKAITPPFSPAFHGVHADTMTNAKGTAAANTRYFNIVLTSFNFNIGSLFLQLNTL
jgi:hypothetical protein